MSDRHLERAAAGVVLPAFAGLEAPDWILRGLEDGLAGVVLFGTNIADPDQLARLCARLREARADLVVAVDEEGGDVTRLAHRSGSPYPGNAALGAADDVTLTRRVHRALGAELAAAGITLDLAPSVDVNTAADNPVIGTRAFGDDPALVARHGAAAVRGLQEAGVAACAKHFPGHGATSADSHLDLPVVDVPLAVLRERDLRPFAAAISAGVAAVMTAHVRVPELTGALPATRSPAALTTLLRGELGFAGAIVTDALDMAGAGLPSADGGGAVPATAVRAFAAGADLLCLGPVPGPREVRATVEALAAEVGAGLVPRGRLERARERVAALGPRPALVGPVPGGEDEAAGSAAARAALRLSGEPGPLHRPLVVELRPPATIAVGDVPWGIAAELLAAVPGSEVVALEPAPGHDDGRLRAVPDPREAAPGTRAGDLVARAEGRSLVVVVRDAHRHPWMRGLVEALVAARPDAVVVEMGLPRWRPAHAGAHLATYGAARANAAAAAELLTRPVASVATVP